MICLQMFAYQQFLARYDLPFQLAQFVFAIETKEPYSKSSETLQVLTNQTNIDIVQNIYIQKENLYEHYRIYRSS